MEERSLRVYEQKTFFSKLGTTLSKFLVPTRVGFNSMMISVKRNNLLKAYETFENYEDVDKEKKESLNKKYEDTFTLYLESIDKYVMDSIYKKVKNGTASPFEEEALSNYYMVTHLKEKQYLEYKYRKQKYLLELDYETVKNTNKEKLKQKYIHFYIQKMDILYKGILKNYSIQLADNLKTSANDKYEIYDKVFDTVEEYINNILNLKLKEENSQISKEILEQYDKYAKFLAGKFDSIDIIEKKTIILAISRKLFTHSLPLIIAEQCYEQLLNEIRSELVHAKNDRKFNKAYKLLLSIMEEYYVNLLSTKIYWEKPKEREEYKAFWENYKKADKIKNKKEKSESIEILFLKKDLAKLLKEENRYKLVIKQYRTKLIELGAMREIKNFAQTLNGKYTKKGVKNLKNKVTDIHFLDIPEDLEYIKLINEVIEKAFYEEGLENKNIYINIILTDPQNIRKTNKEFRNVDKETDVLSFPMFEKEEIINLKNKEDDILEVLGDIMISIERVKQQAVEYNHSFERELAYMLVHGFYHLMGYDHMVEEEKKQMREKEENILQKLNITRGE